MVRVCAWCQRYMGSKEPLENPAVSHGICPACVERQSLADTPVLVVSRARAGSIPLLTTLLRGSPDVSIVVDRRSQQRRNGNGEGRRSVARTERRMDERRRGPALFLV